MTSNTFCRHLSNGYRIYIRGQDITYMPCCQWTGSALPFAQLAQQRQRLNVSTPWAHRECQRCGQEEPIKGQQAYRLVGNRTIDPDLPDTKVGWLDIQADITCNGGCLICGPWNSSFWQNELRRHGEYPIVESKVNLTACIDRIFSELDVSELSLLQFLGGEPFLSDIDTHALRYIKNPSKCKLKYTTNGSIWPKDLRWQQWQPFREISINFSIDAIGDRFNYLRYPLQWKTVNENVQRFVDTAPSNMNFHVNHTLTPFNIFYYQEFLDWANQTFPPEKFLGIHTHTAYGTMSVANCTEDLRREVRSKYGQDHLVTGILDQNPAIDNKDFWNYVNIWDWRRNLKWQDYFSDIVSYC